MQENHYIIRCAATRILDPESVTCAARTRTTGDVDTRLT